MEKEQEFIYRTVYKVEVFSQGNFELESDGEESVLTQIDYAISEGDCIGMVSWESSVRVPKTKVKQELLRIGNDGTFFEEP